MTLYELALKFVGEIREVPGEKDHPYIRWAHSLTAGGEAPDEVAWCSSLLCSWAWLLGLSSSRSKRARSWLRIGEVVHGPDARPGDVVILRRGEGPQPGPEELNAPGHVGIFNGYNNDGTVSIIGGNQSNAVTLERFSVESILGIRRID